MISLIGKRKWEYTTSEISIPSTNPEYPRWRMENALVIAWLLQSMQPIISSVYLFMGTTKEI